jgi:hypothetical protein
MRQETCQKMAVEPVQAVYCITDAEFWVQVEQQMHIAQRTRKVEQHRALARKRRELHTQIHRDRCGADAALGAHDDDQLVLRRKFLDVLILRDTQQQVFQRFGLHRLAEKVLHTAAHSFE